MKRDTSGYSTIVTNVGTVYETYDEKVIKRAWKIGYVEVVEKIEKLNSQI